jgi:MgtC family
MRSLVLTIALLLALPAAAAAVQQPSGTPADTDALQADAGSTKKHAIEADTTAEIRHALFRLPLAAALGAALAFRPRRRGTPPRQPAVIQTQIILAIVGSLVMLVVGTNLARAFGVVGAAGLVRYRAKIEDPKDAGVMLSTLALGLSCGVGLYVLAALSAGVILTALWVIESFEPQTQRLYDLVIKMGDDTDARRDEFDAVLSRYHVDFDLRSSSDEAVSYEVRTPLDMNRERVTNAILRLDPEGHGSVDWSEKKAKTK